MTNADYTVEWRKLERKLAGLQRYAPRNAMRAAATSAFRAIDYENARIAAMGPYKTEDHRPSFRRRASKRGGYRYKIRQSKNGNTSANSAYAKASKYPEMAHAYLVERGWNSKGGRVEGRKFREIAFRRKRRKAQARIVEAMRIAIDIAANDARGRVKVKDVENLVGGWGG